MALAEADLALEQCAVELAVDDAEPSRRDAHPRRGVADAQVAGQRQRAASAHAVARDGSDGGLAAVAHRDRRRLVGRLVDATRPGVGANRGELGDIGTGAKIPARTSQNHDAHVVAAPELGKGLREPSPHGERHGIAFAGPVQGDRGDPVFLSRDDNLLCSAHHRPLTET